MPNNTIKHKRPMKWKRFYKKREFEKHKKENDKMRKQLNPPIK